jgi:uncharacterized sporulation protein YeaH/YhbH (DUF444 family)
MTLRDVLLRDQVSVEAMTHEDPSSIVKNLMEHFQFDKYGMLGDRCVLMVARDSSGSMGTFETNMCNLFLGWIQRLLHEVYMSVEIKYVIHDTDARLTDYATFSRAGGGGGTIVSSALRVIENVIDRYQNTNDIYFYYMSDGDNLTSDNEASLRIIQDRILPRIKFMGYMEMNQYNRTSTIRTMTRLIKEPNFAEWTLREDRDMLDALHALFLPVISPMDTNAGNEHRLPSFEDWATK